MTPQPDVRAVRRSGEAIELELLIPETLAFFPDHFPAFPLLPGVVQVDWAIRYGCEHLRIDGDFRRLRNVKFLHPILPGGRVFLALSPGNPAELLFTYRNARRTCSTGYAVFGSVRAR